ncbi:MAG TPA: tetratricopeptide repeat protein, partial [Polyangiaceae bacterium]|nr:tetratricopeptide repeat protein [Polyangiaceae bacterium]
KQGFTPALRWLEAREAQGQPQATYWLALAVPGHRGEVLLELAIQRLRAAAQHGDAEAMFSLGTAYESGRGVPVDYTQARQWYEQAAELGDPAAQCYLAKMYAHGTGVPRSDDTAFRWYFRAASQKDPQGLFNVGNFIKAGRAGAPDPTNALLYYRQAAELGYLDAQFNLAQLYNDGVGAPVDKAQALKWYSRAAAQGDAESRAKALQLQTAPSTAPPAPPAPTTVASAPPVVPPPPSSSSQEPALTDEQQAWASHVQVRQYDDYFSDEAISGFFARNLPKPTLDDLAHGKHLIWVFGSSYKLGNGRRYCFASVGLANRPPEGRSVRVPSSRYSGIKVLDLDDDQTDEGVRLCRVSALSSAAAAMSEESLTEQLDGIDRTAAGGKPARGEKADPGVVYLFSTGLADTTLVTDSITNELRRAFDYRKLEWLAISTGFTVQGRGVCVSLVGVAARAPTDRNPHVPATVWEQIKELSAEELRQDPNLENCKQQTAATAAGHARASEWDDTGLLSGYERTREDGIALVKPARHPELATNSAGKSAPHPFDLVLGRSSLTDAKAIWAREGATITSSGFGDAMPSARDDDPDGVANPRVRMIDVKGLPVDRLASARFGFLDDQLYWIQYKFEGGADFATILRQVRTKYGAPDQTPARTDASYEWQFGDVRLALTNNFIDDDTMTFTHQPLRRAVSASHASVYAAHIKKKADGQRGF